MGTPDLLVDIAFISDPLTANASTTWVDVSHYVRGEVMLRRGRQHERAEFEAGTATLTLLNTDRRFDPNNTAGPYYGYVKPWRKIRIRARWPNTTGTITAIWAGYVEAWRPSYGAGNDATVTIECVDAFKLFNLYVLEGPSLIEQRADARIGVVLDAIGWPAADRNFDAGVVRIQEATGLVVNALSHMQAIGRSEGGQLLMARSHVVSFESRTRRSAAGIAGTFSDDAAGANLPYAELALSNDDTHIWNYITITRTGGRMQYAGPDTTSKADFGLHRLDLADLLYINDDIAIQTAELYLARYKNARTRVERLVVDPSVRNRWPEILALNISSVVTVIRTGLLGGSPFNQNCVVEALTWRIQRNRWIVTYQLSPHFVDPAPSTTLAMNTTTWIAPTLKNGWTQLVGDTPIGYRKSGDGWVYLRGGIDGSAVSGPVMFTLPVGYRPQTTQNFVVYSSTSATSGPSVNTLSVDTAGNVTHLSGVAYVRLNEVFFRIT